MNNWSKIELDNVCRHITVGFVGTMAEEYVDEGILFLRSQNILPYSLNLEKSQIKFISKEFNDKISKSKLYPGDLAIVRTGYPGTACVIPNDFQEVNCSDLVIVRPERTKINSTYLCYYINSPVGKGAIFGSLVGVAQQHFNVGVAKKMKLFLPPLPIQNKIASILSSYDELIENNNQRIKLLEDMAEEIYKEWFVRLRFPAYESCTMIDGLPEGWEHVKINAITNNHDNKRKPLSSMVRMDIQGKYPYYGAAKVIDSIDDFIFDGKYLLVAEDGSVITTDGYPVLQLVNGKFWVSNHAHVLEGKYPISTEYIYLTLSKYSIIGLITGAAQPKINQENLNRISIIKPSEDFCIRFNRIIVPLFEEMKILADKNQLLQQTRDLLLPRLISGKLSVEHLIEESENLSMAAEPIITYKTSK